MSGWSSHRFSGFLFPLVLVLGSAAIVPAQQASNTSTPPNSPAVLNAPAAPKSPAEMTPHEKTLAADSFAKERLAVWQKRLNLQDWNVSVIVSRARDLKPRTLGNIHWDADKKSAAIRVLDPADYRLPWSATLQDIECTVVHELIHLELSSLPRNEASRRDEEHVVVQITSALLGLDHAHPPAMVAAEPASATAGTASRVDNPVR